MPTKNYGQPSVASASFSGTIWYLHATCQALEKVTLLQKLRIYTHFRNQHKGRCGLWSPSEYQQLLCNSYNQAIQHADSESNLGRRAELLEFRIPHLPFHRNPLLRMIRASSHIHKWSSSTPVHGHVIYVIFHVHLFCLYIGRTECALVQHLRKHWTTARSGSEDNPFHNMLLRTGIHHWTIAPLQWTNCEITACFLERAWWFKWRKWALNACAPAIPSAIDTTAPPPQHTKRLGTVLRRLHCARIDGDFAQIHFLQKEVSAISSGLNIPYVPAPVVKVPDLTGQQKGAVSAVVRSMVKGMTIPRWQRQAIQASIRVVRTVPHTLRKVVEKHQNKDAWDADRPKCYCDDQHKPIWEDLGHVTTIEGHFALLPVTLQH